MPESTAAIRRQFHELFGEGGRLHVVRAPGRANIIGEHTDYNDGFVFPMAIEPEVRIVCRSRDDGKVRLASTAFPGEIVEFSTQEKIERGEPKWTNYPRGVAAEMIQAGVPLPGIDALISNTLPVGGGLSSSAALEVATALAFLALAGLKMDPQRLALLCQKAEHEFARVPSGIMDQTIVVSAKAGHAMLLDCRDMSKQFVPLDANELRVVIVNSEVKHELGGGEYAARRKQCEQGVEYFQKHYPGREIKALRDVTMEMIETAAREKKMDEVVLKRCRHVVGENARCTSAAALLGKRDYEEAGELLVQSHNSLRDDYEVSTAELDFLVEESMKSKGVYGARMTGGGFGGCIVALVQPRAAEPLIAHLEKTYHEKFNKRPTSFITTATAGACVLE
jgi:galactokinase